MKTVKGPIIFIIFSFDDELLKLCCCLVLETCFQAWYWGPGLCGFKMWTIQLWGAAAVWPMHVNGVLQLSSALPQCG